jgi:conjugal transfer pilus assembly protein TraU
MKRVLNLAAAAVIASAFLFSSGAAQAQAIGSIASSGPSPSSFQCPDAGIWNELIGGVCWSSIFPIMMAGAQMSFNGNSMVPAGAAAGAKTCHCSGNANAAELPRWGIPIGYWQPSMLVEVVPHPFCMPSLGGVYPGGSGTNSVLFSGGVGGHDKISNRANQRSANFWNVHQWSFPLVTMLNVLNIPNCGTGYNGINLMNLSEVQPQWNDDMTAELLWPESAVLAGPVGVFGAVGECLEELPPGRQPIDSMYWTAGCWGDLFPPSGDLAAAPDAVQDSNLDAAKFISTQYRLGFGVQTMGTASMCGPKSAQIMPKSMFRWQLLYPNNETTSAANKSASGSALPASTPQTGMSYSSDNADTALSPAQTNAQLGSILNAGVCTHWTGQNALEWGEWLDQPGTGSNYVYIVFQWTDCCMGLVGGSLNGS